MSTIDEHGNVHDGEGKFSEKNNSRPAALGADSGGGASRPFGMVALDAPGPGGYDLIVNAPSGRRYLKGDVLHRTDGPAYEGVDGTEEWRQDGELHREGAPAVVSEGYRAFYEHGEAVAV